MKKMQKKLIYLFCLLGLTFIASLPALRSGIYDAGHDLQFHLGRMQAIAEELSNGQFPVRYESSAWYGHGYVSTTFYGNIFLYFPALLYNAGIKLWRCYNIYVILINLATVFIGFYSFKGLFKSGKWGLLATGLYTLAGYRLTNLYVRAAVGEYTAMVFIPLVIYGVYRIYENEQPKGKLNLQIILPIVVGATGLIQSHILTTEIAAIFILIYALINLVKTKKHIKELLIASLAILGVNAFFIIPFINAYTSMDLYINSELTEASIRPDGLYISQLFGPLTKGGGSSFPWTAVDEGHLNTGLILSICMAATLLGSIVSLKKRERNISKDIVILFAFGMFAAWMSTLYFPWDAFAGQTVIDKLLSSVQYPWRYLMVVTICFILTGVYNIQLLGEKIVIPALVCMGIVGIVCTGYFYRTLSVYNETIYDETAREDWADKLYLPEGTDRGLLENTDTIINGNQVILTVLAYENVHVYDGNNNEIEWTNGANNCISVTYDGNLDTLNTRFVEPVLWRVSELISVGVAILILIVLRCDRKLGVNNGNKD